eukprot:TRINITY_DN3511_c0_g2_i1.p1 TRINITY_DN3511_c0_g2~~TRINITY_DN3511_c0_g2_i1.p1  ORF type:complete len:855 (-),score=148.20 TRINITY_DN3511_c0_g2_i1:45-2609(-)
MCRGACTRVRRLFDLRFESKEDEESFLQHFTTERHRVASLTFLSFFLPFTSFQALALHEAREEEGWKLISSLGIHFIAVFLVCFLASISAAVTWCAGALKNATLCRLIEPLWASLAVSSLGLLLSSFAHGEGAQPSVWQSQVSPSFFVSSLIVSIFAWLPVRSVVSSFLVLLALLLSVVAAFFETGPKAMEVSMAVVVLGSSYRLAYICESRKRQSWLFERNRWSDLVPDGSTCSKEFCGDSPRASPVSQTSARSRHRGKEAVTPTAGEAVGQSSGVSSKSPQFQSDHNDPPNCSDSDKSSIIQSPEQERNHHECNSAQTSGKDMKLLEGVREQAGPTSSSASSLCALRVDRSLMIQEVSQLEIKVLGYDPAGHQFLSIFEEGCANAVKQELDKGVTFSEPLNVHVQTSSGLVLFELCVIPTGLGDPVFLAILHVKTKAENLISYIKNQNLPTLPAVPEHPHSNDARSQAEDASKEDGSTDTANKTNGAASLFGGSSESSGSAAKSVCTIRNEAEIDLRQQSSGSSQQDILMESSGSGDKRNEALIMESSSSSEGSRQRKAIDSSSSSEGSRQRKAIDSSSSSEGSRQRKAIDSSSSSEGSRQRKANDSPSGSEGSGQRKANDSSSSGEGSRQRKAPGAGLFSPAMLAPSPSGSSLYALSSDSLSSWDIGASPIVKKPMLRTIEASCQTSLHWDNLGWKCKHCEKPPLPPASTQNREEQWQKGVQEKRWRKRKRSRSKLPSNVLDGLWVFVEGPEDTSPWLKELFFHNDLVQCCDGRIFEMKITPSAVFLAGGELLFDEKGRLHRVGKSGKSFIYERASPSTGQLQREQAVLDPDEVDCCTDEESVVAPGDEPN